MIVAIILILAVVVLLIASMWTLFAKAGKPGWAAIVPIYNTLTLLEIIKKPWWWLLLMMIPYINIIWHIWSLNLFVKSFGKSTGYTIGVIFLPIIFLPMLAFSSSTQFLGAQNVASDPRILDAQ
ncbi:MAG: signal peptidase I [Cytophagaceae bacterium]|nr:signal peptidase I [Cytophagaceae bacterium]